MRAATRARRWPRWLRSGLSLCMLMSVLATVMPHLPTYAAPDDQGAAGRAAANVCRESAPPLIQTYVDRPNGFSLQYPEAGSSAPLGRPTGDAQRRGVVRTRPAEGAHSILSI